jgi:glucose-6-phosphate isomerase
MTLLARQQVYPGLLKTAYMTQMERAGRANLVSEIINRNPTVFKTRQKTHQKVILNRLGWMEVIREMPGELERMENLVRQVREDGLLYVFVLGMGGSSLSAEVFGRIFGKKNWLKKYTIVDTTAPSKFESIVRDTDFVKAFFIVSSKSGATTETMSQFRFFFRKVKELRPLKAGRHFLAITDSGSDLHRIARRNRFREVFLNRSDIGNRYSALSYSGLVPGAFTRANLGRLLEGADERLRVMETKANDCDALKLGVLMGIGAKNGVDKLRFRTTADISPLAVWIEQLVAESTGKESRGIIPVEGDIKGGVESNDLMDIYYSMRGEKKGDRQLPSAASTRESSHVSIEMPEILGIGAEMLKWEMATTVASSVMGVNPFDEPNVDESRKNTGAILHARRGPRKVVPVVPVTTYAGIDIVSTAGIKGLERKRKVSPEEVFTGFFAGIPKDHYISLICYTEMGPAIEQRLSQLRQMIESKYNVITLRGYGPRFLYSTGQLFKGGSQKGHFLVMEREYETDYDIPGQNISFGRLIKAQAQGDMKALRRRKRPVVNINLKLDPAGGLDYLMALVNSL